MLPQPIAAKQLKVTAIISGKTYTYTHPNSVTISENKKYTLTLNVGKNSMSLDGNVSVEGFEEDDKSDIGGGKLQESITITPSNEQQVLQGGNGERYIIEGNGEETTGRIVIEGGDAEVTLKNVNIKVTDATVVDRHGEAIEVKSGSVTFILEGKNTLEAYGAGSALYNHNGSTIILKGDGELKAIGKKDDAGIGGS